MVTTASTTDTEGFIDHDQVLEQIQDRVLWLSMNMVHHANNVRSSPDGKVGGHQASSASVATIMTSLYFDFMRVWRPDIGQAPRRRPCIHAIQYLLGQSRCGPTCQDAEPAFHGLQAYPSRTKDPDGVDFSTGAVGLGAGRAQTSPRSWTSTSIFAPVHGRSRL